MNYIITLMPSIIEGLKNTLGVFILTLLLSIPLGIIVAILRLSNIKIVNFISSLYVLVMRGTPFIITTNIYIFWTTNNRS